MPLVIGRVKTAKPRTLRDEIEERDLARKIIRALIDGKTFSATLRQLRVGYARAAALMARYGVDYRAKRSLIPSTIDIVAFSEGLTTREAAELLGVSAQTVRRRLREAGAARRRGHPQTIDVEEARSMRAAGYSHDAIAEILGCSRKGIARVLCDGKRGGRRIDPAAVVELRDQHGFGWDDIAVHLSCNRDTARKLYYQAKRAA